MAPDLPSWTDDLIRSHLDDDEQITGFDLIEDSRSTTIGLVRTPQRAFVARKPRGLGKLIGRDEGWVREVATAEPGIDEGERREVACDDCGTTFAIWTDADTDTVHCISCGTTLATGTSRSPEPTEGPGGAFVHNGYTLYRRTVDVSGGGTRTVHFFSKEDPDEGRPVPLPDGYEVGEIPATGLPFLRRTEEGVANEDGTVPVEAVHGIGDSYGRALRDAGIATVGELVEADHAALVEATGADEDDVRAWRRLGGLADVDGIGPAYGVRLLAADVTSIEDLVGADPADLAEATGIPEATIERFVTLSGLLEVDGVGLARARQLLAAGIDSAATLAEAEPADLAEIDGISASLAEELVRAAGDV